MPDLSVYGKLNSFADYQRANEEFMLKKQMAAAQMSNSIAALKNQQLLEESGGMTPYQREYLRILDEKNNVQSEGFGKPPSGYRFNEDGTLTAIPGGPGETISAELSARLGLANKTLGEMDELKQAAASGVATGPLDYATGALGFGESGKIQRRIADGADALQRMLTGAGMPQSEAADYANRFRVTVKDNSSTVTDKLNNLENILKEQITMSTRGRGTVLPSTPSGSPSGGKKINWSDL